MMVPLIVSGSDHDLVRAALHNIEQFNTERHEAWLKLQPPARVELALLRPPNALYRHHGRFAVILGYGQGTCVVHVLGVAVGPGSLTEPVFVSPFMLEDVTEAARARFGLTCRV